MASKLKELQNRHVGLTKALRLAADAIPGPLPHTASDEEREAHEAKKKETQAKYEALGTELDEVEAALAREQRVQDRERVLIPSGPTPDAPAPTVIPIEGDPPPAEAKNWDSLGGYLQAVAYAATNPASVWDPRLRADISGMQEGIASQGGFLVQTDFVTELLQRTYASNQILNGGPGYGGVSKIPIGAGKNGVKINAVDETSRADGSRWGGIQAYWIEEGGTKEDTKPKFRQIQLSLKKLIGLCYATDELLQDATALEAIIKKAFAAEFAFKIQDALINGTGAGLPLGILNSGCLITQAKETGQVAATIVKENVEKMWSRMWPSGLVNSVWFINQQCYPALFAMSHVVGTGGIPVFLPPGGLSQSPFGTLMGRPLVPIEQCEALGTKGDIYFCDWSEYLFADKENIKSDSSIHVRFIYDETAFRFVYRADGQPAWALPTTPFKGGATATTGPFLTLATRS